MFRVLKKRYCPQETLSAVSKLPGRVCDLGHPTCSRPKKLPYTRLSRGFVIFKLRVHKEWRLLRSKPYLRQPGRIAITAFLDKFHRWRRRQSSGDVVGEDQLLHGRMPSLHTLPFATLLPRAPRISASLGTLTVQYDPIVLPSDMSTAKIQHESGKWQGLKVRVLILISLLS
jgi:hypothetical protein